MKKYEELGLKEKKCAKYVEKSMKNLLSLIEG